MEINIPIFVKRSTEAGGVIRHRCEPLFHHGESFHGESADLGKAIRRLTETMRRWAVVKLNEADQSIVSRWDVAEPIETTNIKLHLCLSDRTLKLKLLLVLLTKNSRTIVFSPSLAHVWFDLLPGERIEERANDVYTAHFNQCLKDRNETDIAAIENEDDFWIDTIRLSLDSNTVPRKPRDPLLAMLGGSSASDGASELMQVGRCLDWIDIDSLADPIGLDDSIQRIVERLSLSDRRGLVLVGPSGSGKTAAIEGAVRRRRLAEATSERRGLVWQLTPARLISGMSYLGQWQSRLLTIWKYAHRQDLVLYIEDMLGLFEAGVTRDSRACAADLIRSQLEVSPVRLITEMTPEAWAIFRERDRAFAQQFIVLPMEGKNRDDSLPILLGIVSHLEAKYRCRFRHDVLSEVLGLYDRFERTSVLPGKAISALQRLATTHERKPIDRAAAQSEFTGRTGLSKLVIDTESRLTRAQIIKALGEQVFGQESAVERLADRILAAAARINDTSRPLGVFLLLGPTGVGKTELAKTIARYLFGDDGLIRIDMNELATADASARLVGTFSSPDGILTMAARRRPHAVLLLDEIEKADPSVLDTLLQVIGEARLTDARGRTVDLSGMMILMTSNLGASHSRRSTVLNDGEHLRSETYRRAAKDFFRPEFFNRIDGLLEFEPLDLDVVAEVAQRQIDEVLQRDGLGRRMMVVDIDQGVLREIVSRGFDPRLGARAVKRQIEREVVCQIANVLVKANSDELMVVHATSGAAGLQLSVKSIESLSPEVSQSKADRSIESLLIESKEILARIEEQTPKRPISISTTGQGIDPELLRYLTLQEQIQACRSAIRAVEDIQDHSPTQHSVAIQPAAPRVRQLLRSWIGTRKILLELQSSNDLQQYLRDGTESRSISSLELAGDQLCRAVQRLVILYQGISAAYPHRFVVESYGDHSYSEASDNKPLELRMRLIHLAQELLKEEDSSEKKEIVRDSRKVSMVLQEPIEQAICSSMLGGWMRVSRTGGVSYAQVALVRCDEEAALNAPELAAIRWMLTGDQAVDLKTGDVYRDSDPNSLLLQLVKGVVPSFPRL